MYTVQVSNDHSPSQKEGLLSLGRFAQAAGLSRKALRLYDQLGILLPDYVDPGSGYRYYNPGQYEKARFIRLLRAMEMPLADIRNMLEAGTTREAVDLVLKYTSEFEKKAQQVHLASQKVIAYLRKEHLPMSILVSTEDFPAFQAVSIKKNIAVPGFHAFIPEALSRLSQYVEEVEAEIIGDPICFYYGPVNKNDDGPVEICFPINGNPAPAGDILLREIPLHQGAIGKATVKQSRFPDILEVWDAVVSWVQHNGLIMTEETVPCYEIWHADETISVVQPFESGD